jgi:hypothetical protein
MSAKPCRCVIEKDFVYLRYNWISTSQRLSAVAALLAEKCRRSRGTKRQVYKDFAPAFNVVLTSLEVSGAYSANQWIRIVTDRDVYGGKSQRSPAHNREVQTALEWLIEKGYLLHVDGRRKVKSTSSSQVHDIPFAYVITDKWRSDISDRPISHQHEIQRNPLASYVQLRKKVKASVKGKERSVSLQINTDDRQHYPDLIDGTEKLLAAADDVWRQVRISLDGETLPSTLASMTRIFNNGSFDEGGRFYCQLQNLPKTQRVYLRFDDEPTVEIDFTGMHPHLIYHLQGDDFSGDPYELAGFGRDAVKVAFNTLINRDGKKHRGPAARSLARNLNISLAKATELENALYRLHHRIAGQFNTGYGLKLQKLDSQIAYEVMMHFFIDSKRPLLMIHDSAIVSVRDVETLKLCMVDAYRSVVFKELQKNGCIDHEFAPLPKGLKINSANFNETLTNTIYRALEGNDVHADEWTTAMKAS